MILGDKNQQILINEQTGLIERVGQGLGTADLFASGMIFPGFIDLHVHTRVDVSGGELYKEDLDTASAAAIHGGVVHIADMPNNPVPPVDDESYDQKKSLFAKCPVDVTLYAGIGPGSRPLTTKVPYKVYMGKSVGELFFESLGQLEQTIKNYTGQFVSFHCEDPEILKTHENESTHAARRPREAEIKAIGFVLELIKKYGIKGKVCHLSTKEGLEKIKQAKAAGVNVTCEVAPHHLFFDESADLQINPPLRTKEDCKALIAGLKAGVIDYLATDHAPHSAEDRTRGVSGMPHLDTYGAFTTWLMTEQGFTVADITRVCAENPGKFVNEFSEEKFGKIESGYVGSLTIIEMQPQTIEKQDLKTKSAWSPFERIAFPGQVSHTIIRGKVYER